MQLQGAGARMGKYLRRQRSRTLTWGFAYAPSRRRVIGVAKSRVAVSDFMHADVHIKKSQGLFGKVFSAKHPN